MDTTSKPVILESDAPPELETLSNFVNRFENLSQEEDISMTISAPGKVILYGEHSVVYGKSAVAASLGLRTKLYLTEVQFKFDEPNYIRVDLPNIHLTHVYDLQELQNSLLVPVLPLSKDPSNYNWTKPELIDHDKLVHIISDYVNRTSGSFPLTPQKNAALCSLFYLFTGILGSINIDLKPFHLRIETELNISSGSGSSAAYSVTLAAAFIHYLRLIVSKTDANISKSGYKAVKTLHVDLRNFTDEELNIISKWAFLAEKIMHGSPSGIDNTVCTYGSLVHFQKTTGAKVVKFQCDVKLLLVSTSVRRDTKRLLNAVVMLKGRYSAIVEPIFEAMDQIALSAVSCLACLDKTNVQHETEDCFRRLGELTDINQHLLQALGVSHLSLDRICSIVKLFNLNAKLTGAGGGGYAIVLITPYTPAETINQLREKLSTEGFDTILTDLAGPGVRIDSCNISLDTL